MSAWLCSERHLSVLVNATDNRRPEHFEMLLAENLRSLEHRYPGRDFLDEWKADAMGFAYRSATAAALIEEALAEERPTIPVATDGAITATQIVKACNCYDYQACETDDYKKTPSARYVEQVRRRAIDQGGQTEGALYDALLWGL